MLCITWIREELRSLSLCSSSSQQRRNSKQRRQQQRRYKLPRFSSGINGIGLCNKSPFTLQSKNLRVKIALCSVMNRVLIEIEVSRAKPPIPNEFNQREIPNKRRFSSSFLWSEQTQQNSPKFTLLESRGRISVHVSPLGVHSTCMCAHVHVVHLPHTNKC